MSYRRQISILSPLRFRTYHRKSMGTTAGCMRQHSAKSSSTAELRRYRVDSVSCLKTPLHIVYAWWMCWPKTSTPSTFREWVYPPCPCPRLTSSPSLCSPPPPPPNAPDADRPPSWESVGQGEPDNVPADLDKTGVSGPPSSTSTPSIKRLRLNYRGAEEVENKRMKLNHGAAGEGSATGSVPAGAMTSTTDPVQSALQPTSPPNATLEASSSALSQPPLPSSQATETTAILMEWSMQSVPPPQHTTPLPPVPTPPSDRGQVLQGGCPSEANRQTAVRNDSAPAPQPSPPSSIAFTSSASALSSTPIPSATTTGAALPLPSGRSSSPAPSVFSLVTPRTSMSSATQSLLRTEQLTPHFHYPGLPTSSRPSPTTSLSTPTLPAPSKITNAQGPSSTGPTSSVMSNISLQPDFEAASFQKWLGKSARGRRHPSNVAVRSPRVFTPRVQPAATLPTRRDGPSDATSDTSNGQPLSGDDIRRPWKRPRLSDEVSQGVGGKVGAGDDGWLEVRRGEEVTNTLGIDLGARRPSVESQPHDVGAASSNAYRPTLGTGGAQDADHAAATAAPVVRADVKKEVWAPRLLSSIPRATLKPRIQAAPKAITPEQSQADDHDANPTPPAAGPSSTSLLVQNPHKEIAAASSQERVGEPHLQASGSGSTSASAQAAPLPPPPEPPVDPSNIQTPGGKPPARNPATWVAENEVTDTRPIENAPAGMHLRPPPSPQTAEDEGSPPSSPSGSTESPDEGSVPPAPAVVQVQENWNLLGNRAKRAWKKSTRLDESKAYEDDHWKR